MTLPFGIDVSRTTALHRLLYVEANGVRVA